MNIYVQSFLNSGTKLTVSVTTSTTVAQLKTAVNGLEGVNTAIMQFYIVNTVTNTSTALVSTNTLGVYGVTTGTVIGSSNTISGLSTNEAKQIAKLDLAQLRKQSGGNTSTNYYRTYNIYNRDLLAAKYVGNTATNISNTLTEHRPWTV